MLAESITALQNHFARFRGLSLRLPDKVLSSHREHLEILQFLLDRNGALIERKVHRHFEHASRFLIESVARGEHGRGVVVAPA